MKRERRKKEEGKKGKTQGLGEQDLVKELERNTGTNGGDDGKKDLLEMGENIAD